MPLESITKLAAKANGVTDAMAYLLGTDEAGYGPNLGPLVVSATLFRVPDAPFDGDLYDVLGDVVARECCIGEARLPIADSKLLYKSGGGLAALEHAVLAALRLCRGAPDREPVAAGPIPADGARRGVSQASSIECWRSIWTHLDQSLDGEFDSIDWFRDYDADLPCDAALDAVERHADALFAGLAQADVELLAVRSRVVCAGRFNQLLEQRGNKANVLSHTTLELLAELLEPLDEGAIRIHCDKHGGRNRYAPLLQQTFPEHLIEVHCESRAESLYRWGPRERRVEIHFTAGGEAALPAALASMTSKYLRELAMRAFNDFWVREVPGIRPTAGYPVDAQRFRKAIAARQAELAIDDCVLWRNK